MKDTLIEIKVNVGSLGGEMDFGFASLKSMSVNSEEKEILFNPINCFKVVYC